LLTVHGDKWVPIRTDSRFENGRFSPPRHDLRNPVPFQLMKTRTFFLVMLTMLLPGLIALAGDVPRDQYAKLLVGKWSVRELVYHFQKDGTYAYYPEGDEASATKGTWKLEGAKLLLQEVDGDKAVVGIKFNNPDTWIWESAPGRNWEVHRIGR
jgi:hypothetical protein